MRHALALLFASGAAAAFAQSAAAPAFEVASIKPAKPGPQHLFEVTPAGNLTWQTSVGQAIRIAYKVRPPFQIYGAPGWAESEEYLIAAKSPEGSPPINPNKLPEEAEFLQRIQTLLAERFHLKVHRENREMPVYVLIAAKGGPKLQPGDPTQPFRLKLGKGSISNDGAAKLGTLASVLSNNLDRPVFDETGLTGSYSLHLKWTPDAAPSAPGQPPPASAGDAGPSLFTALQEQLGLKLESVRRPVEVLVIDHVEPPTEN
jgi:uncharacterized protein (TIGR03435 family)